MANMITNTLKFAMEFIISTYNALDCARNLATSKLDRTRKTLEIESAPINISKLTESAENISKNVLQITDIKNAINMRGKVYKSNMK